CTGDRLIEFLVNEVFVFIKQTFLFPRLVNCATADLNEGKKLSGEAPSPGFRSWFLYFLPKIPPAWQANSVQMPTVASNSRNGGSFSSAGATNRLPSPRWASAIQIVRPSESKADTQPQLHPAFSDYLRLADRIFHTRRSGRVGLSALAVFIFREA